MKKLKILSWLAVRLIFIVFFSSSIQEELFVPFFTITGFNFHDPWSAWVNSSGRSDAFPYGLVMYLVFLPAIVTHKILQSFSIEMGFSYLILTTVLLIEFFIFRAVRVFDMESKGAWPWFAIFSPLSIYISYVHGQIDLIPSALFFASALFAMRNHWGKAGLMAGLACAAKFSFVLGIPFFLVFFLSRGSKRKAGSSFVLGLIPGLFFLLLPAIYSQGYHVMVLETPEVLKTLDAQIQLGISVLYLLPVVYLIVILAFWSLNHISTFVLVSYVGIGYLVLAFTQTSSVGWYYWSLPFALFTLRKSSTRTLALYYIWQLNVVLFFLSAETVLVSRFFGDVRVNLSEINLLSGLLFTSLVVLGVVLVLKIMHEAGKLGDIYSLSKKPLAINIAGDSGVGKDTLTNEIARLFGDQEVALLLGDDYHLHERGDSSWLSTTHLSTDSNDLEGMGKDFKKLLNDERVFVKHYDHRVGRFTLPRGINSSQVVIANGIHSILIPGSELADLKIFMSMDDDLRVQLKISRDMASRHYANEAEIRKSIVERAAHYQEFVLPQLHDSDLHFHMKCISFSPLRLGVVLESKDSAFVREISQLLNAVLSTPSILQRSHNAMSLEIDPTYFKNQDAVLILNRNLESPEQLFTSSPVFSDGSVGVLSLISILYLLRKRRNYV
ncbi:Phosphoribulokinase/uridine kinase [Candidatus Nanopelagicaceae bacterium]